MDDELTPSPDDGTGETDTSQPVPFSLEQINNLHLSLSKEGQIVTDSGVTAFWVRLQANIPLLPGQDPTEAAASSYTFLSAQVNNMIAGERENYEMKAPEESPTGEW